MNITDDSCTRDHRQILTEKGGQVQRQFQKMRSSLSSKSSKAGFGLTSRLFGEQFY